MLFEVRVIRGGQIASIEIDALNRDDALRQAEASALRPLEARPIRRGGLSLSGVGGEKFDLAIFSQELLALLQAGLAVIEAIETLAERGRSGDGLAVLRELANRLREGKSLSEALASLPQAFPALFVGIVRASERTGDLQPALERYIDYRSRLDSLRAKLLSAAIYPALLVVVGMAVTLFLGGYVVPRFAVVYQGAGRSLPWASSLLLEWGRFANAHLPHLAAIATALAVGAALAVRRLRRRNAWSGLFGRLPVISRQARTYELSRLYLTLGMLVDSGLPIMQSLALATESLPAHLRAPIETAAQEIRRGERLSVAFERCGLVTPVGIRMLRVGEESGRLGEMMTRTARFHDGEVARWIERFSRAAEPLLMIGIGLVVGTIVVLLYMPIFDLAGSLR